MRKKEFKVADFGAVGDGVTNDGLAICKALSAALQEPDDIQKEIIFEGEKTYRITEISAENTQQYLFTIQNAKNIHLHGCGCKLLFQGAIRLIYLHRSENCSMDGFVIDYSPRPFILGTVIAVNRAEQYMDFETAEDVGLTDEPMKLQEWWFAFPNTAEKRYHYFMKEYQKLGDRRCRLVIHENTANRIDEVKIGDEFLLPLVGGSHFVGAACTITDCNGFMFRNIRFYSHPEFGFDVRSNRGKMLFDGIALKPRDDAPDQLVSWRDGFHVKDNLDPIVWNNCYLGTIGDDAFNLSCVHLDVTKVEADQKTICAYPAEKGSTRPLAVGDEFVAYDLETGREIGRGRAAQVIDSDSDVEFVSDVSMPLLKKGMQISFYKFANPGFVVKNSYIEGTVRVRSSGTFENCKFNVFWVRIENEFFVEGPIPRDVVFKNCEFTTPYEGDPEIFHVGTLGKNGLTNCEYKCTGIVLDNCRFTKGHYFAEKGNELIVRP